VYLSFGLEGEFVGVGAWHMSPATLSRYRALVDDPRQGAQIQKLVDGLLAQGFELHAMEKLKRVPPPFAQDHSRAELLKHKGLALGVQPPEDCSGSRVLLDWTEATLRATAPLMHRLDKSLSQA
jgi:uncharacterized protein (DUF2461 family)